MRISAVDGTAFVDFSAANVLTDHIGKRLTVFDSAGKKLIGFIKAAGTGETYGDDKIIASDDRDFTMDTGWWTGEAGITIDDATADKCNFNNVTNKTLYKAGLFAGTRQLWKIIGVLSGWTRGDFRVQIGALFSLTITGNGAFVRYMNDGAYPHFYFRGNGVGNIFDLDDVSIKQVLTPSATGVTIVSACGGTVFNWESKEAGFNYNDSAGYEYLITNQRAIFANYYRQMRAA